MLNQNHLPMLKYNVHKTTNIIICWSKSGLPYTSINTSLATSFHYSLVRTQTQHPSTTASCSLLKFYAPRSSPDANCIETLRWLFLLINWDVSRTICLASRWPIPYNVTSSDLFMNRRIMTVFFFFSCWANCGGCGHGGCLNQVTANPLSHNASVVITERRCLCIEHVFVVAEKSSFAGGRYLGRRGSTYLRSGCMKVGQVGVGCGRPRLPWRFIL